MKEKKILFILIGAISVLVIGLVVCVILLSNQNQKINLMKQQIDQLSQQFQYYKEEIGQQIDKLSQQLQYSQENIDYLKEKERIKKEAWQEIEIVDISVDRPLLKGGMTLYSVTLYNPTNYTFVDIEYEFYDNNDNVTKFRGTIAGPLPSNTTKKFHIDKWTEGLWEHTYGVKIIGAKAIE